jgi:hypothetical protein
MPKKLNEQTKIEVGFKHVIALFSGILTVMFGFYMLVIVPKFETNQTQMDKMDDNITAGFETMNTNFKEVYSGIGTLNGNVEGINARFRDLNQIKTDEGGGF